MDHIMKGRGLSIIAAVLLAAAVSPIASGSEGANARCGPCFNCASCDGTRCCSTFGYCGDTPYYCSDAACAMNCNFYTPKCRPGACTKAAAAGSNRTRTTSGGRWDLKESAACSIQYPANISFDGVVEQGSGGGQNPFCRNQGSGGGQNPFCRNQGEPDATATYHSVCGHCLKVTGRKDGKQTEVRLLVSEECSDRQLSALGRRVFEELSIDGEGRADNQGYLAVDYQVVHCDDGH